MSLVWKRGWFLKSLKYLVERDLRETVYASVAYKKNRWGSIESLVVRWNGNKARYLFLLLTAFFVLHALVVTNKQYILGVIPSGLGGWGWLSGWQSTILGAQLTIIGLIFPLVIGLVGFLLQSKTASKAIWSVYNRYSGFLFTGYSGLLLSIYIVLGPYLGASIPVFSYAFHCASATAWFVFNILLSGWFLGATFKVVQENSRDELLKRYTINEVFIPSIRKRLSALIPANAINSGVLKGSSKGRLQISTVHYGSADEESYEKTCSREKYLENIYFRFINLAVAIMQLRKYFRREDQNIELILPATKDNIPRNSHKLATAIGFKFHKLDWFILSYAYRFSSKKPFDDEEVSDILLALTGTAADELRTGSPNLFEKTIKRMAEWHCETADSLAFTNDNGNRDNWLLLPSSAFWARNYLHEIFREYYQLGKLSVEKIPDSIEYFQDMAHLHIKLHNWGKEKQPAVLTKELITGSYLNWAALISWSADLSMKPGTKLFSQYENAIISYVGAWESWPMYLEPRSERWIDSLETLPHFTHHLRSTCQQVASAVRNGDELASRWSADMVIHWFSNVSSHRHPNSRYRWLDKLITLSLLDKGDEDSIRRRILRGDEAETTDLALIAVENLWIDARIICACFIRSRFSGEYDVLTGEVSNALIKSQKFHSTGGVDRASNPINSGSDVIGSYLRQRSYWDDEKDAYGSILNSFVESMASLNEVKRVSGRIYSSSGSDDVRSLSGQYVQLAIEHSARSWGLPRQWREFVLSDSVEKNHRDQIIGDLKLWLGIVEDQYSDEVKAEDKTKNFNQSIEGIVVELKSYDSELIKKAKIDRSRLDKFAEFASASGFAPETGSSLLSRFEDIVFTEESIDEFKQLINIGGYSKSEISEGILENRPVNEDDWLDNAVSQNIDLNLNRAIFNQPKFKNSSYESDNDLLAALKELIAEHEQPGKYSVYLGSWGIYKKLSDLAYKIDDSGQFNIERRDSHGSRYVCHFEGTPVFETPFRKEGAALLVPNDIYKQVTFRKYRDEVYVHVDTKDLDEETQKLTLVLEYCMKVELHDKEAFKLISNEPDEE